MRMMPSKIENKGLGRGHGAREIPVPAIPPGDWMDAVRALVARPLTDDDLLMAKKMASRNWTVRVAAEAILGRSLTEGELQSRRTW